MYENRKKKFFIGLLHLEIFKAIDFFLVEAQYILWHIV